MRGSEIDRFGKVSFEEPLRTPAMLDFGGDEA